VGGKRTSPRKEGVGGPSGVLPLRRVRGKERRGEYFFSKKRGKKKKREFKWGGVN